MRNLVTALFAAAFALVGAGCSSPGPVDEANAEVSLANLCVTYCNAFGVGNASPSDDPWQTAGKSGYILTGAGFGNTIVFGVDKNMARVWSREVIGDAAVEYYRSLPESIPFECASPLTFDVGQVGSTNVETGGGNEPCVETCIAASDLAKLHSQCLCQPTITQSTCSAERRDCGTITDVCKTTISCGVCPGTQSCSSAGQCVSKPIITF